MLRREALKIGEQVMSLLGTGQFAVKLSRESTKKSMKAPKSQKTGGKDWIEGGKAAGCMNVAACHIATLAPRPTHLTHPAALHACHERARVLQRAAATQET